MDMWQAYINGVTEVIEGAEGLICFDRFHGAAERNGKRLLAWISRSRLEPMVNVGRMVRRYLWGSINAIILRATNASAESINAKIRKITVMACGFGNRARLRTAILFHKGGSSLLPKIGARYQPTRMSEAPPKSAQLIVVSQERCSPHPCPVGNLWPPLIREGCSHSLALPVLRGLW